MYLQRLEIHGFKSFAQKTVLEFLMPASPTGGPASPTGGPASPTGGPASPTGGPASSAGGTQGGKKGITAIVGPNGSGKSNVADAIRWVLGEQSLKTLRGKKSEDVIFAGSDKKARLGVAEVSLFLNNEDNEAQIDMSEVTITRRIYRDGESEYLINNRTARLQDIVLLLARARFGQKNYLVIGQGMADYILRATPLERKELLDEAAGIKELQIKRQMAFNKLESSQNNLTQAENILKEIEPRLKYLQRQTRRLAEREEVEKQLRELQKKYYGQLWHNLASRLAEFEQQFARIDEDLQKKKKDQQEVLSRFKSLEEKSTTSQDFLDWQKKYEEILAARGRVQEKKFKLQSQIELMRVRSEKAGGSSTLPYENIILELEAILQEQEAIENKVAEIKTLNELSLLQKIILGVKAKTTALLNKIKSPVTKKNEAVVDQALAQEIAELDKELAKMSGEIASVNSAMQNLNEAEKQKKGEIFELQRVLQAKQLEVHKLEQDLNGVQIELAKLETKRDGLAEEISLEMGDLSSEVKLQPQLKEPIVPEEVQPQIFKLKHQLELIGGIDAEIVAEHKETSERYNFLFAQVTDLQKAIADVVATIADLDRIMKERRDEAMQKINDEFNRFFQILFSGGSAKLIMLYEDPTKKEETEEGEEEGEIKEESHAKDLLQQTGEPILVGIDIQATPPGKRIKDINILSGGERALASVALICAILSYSPSPFVVLDEVDAALDEANSLRLAEIIDQLSARTQFIMITHNRATMSKALVLYGVTMGDDGVSRLLSVKLEEAEKMVIR